MCKIFFHSHFEFWIRRKKINSFSVHSFVCSQTPKLGAGNQIIYIDRNIKLFQRNSVTYMWCLLLQVRFGRTNTFRFQHAVSQKLNEKLGKVFNIKFPAKIGKKSGTKCRVPRIGDCPNHHVFFIILHKKRT